MESILFCSIHRPIKYLIRVGIGEKQYDVAEDILANSDWTLIRNDKKVYVEAFKYGLSGHVCGYLARREVENLGLTTLYFTVLYDTQTPKSQLI